MLSFVSVVVFTRRAMADPAPQGGALMQILIALAGFRPPEEPQTVLWNLIAAGHLKSESSSESASDSNSSTDSDSESQSDEGPAPKQRRVRPFCAVRDIIVDEMKQLSFNVILKTKANSPDIVVADQNVEEIGNQKWDSDPFKVHEHNNRLFCRNS